MSTAVFSPVVQAWFEASFAAPTDAQAKAWPAIRRVEHTLLLAPTGSGKTLAAFLAAIERLSSTPPPERARRTRVLYLSPLRALAVDVEKNLRAPLAGIRLAAERLGTDVHEPTVGRCSGWPSRSPARAIPFSGARRFFSTSTASARRGEM